MELLLDPHAHGRGTKPMIGVKEGGSGRMPWVRVVIAPDCFSGTLSAPEAAEAIALGWSRARPYDEVVTVPLSDGGPGFLDCLPGRRITVLVEDPLGRPTTASYLLDGTTAYVEAAQACGLALLDPAERDPGVTTTFGVGQLVRAAADAGARRVVVGLGGSATNDGGAGCLSALGVRRHDRHGDLLPPGGLALAQVGGLAGAAPEVELVAATDVDCPLLGPTGATALFAPQKGAAAEQLEPLERALAAWADALERHLGVDVRDRPGAGAAGGLGFALLALGAQRVPGVEVVAEAVGLAGALAGADLVVTGEGRLDGTSTRGKVVSGVASLAAEHGVPCVAIAGEVLLGRREAAAAGLAETHALVDAVGRERALADAAGALADAAESVARGWTTT